MLWGGDINDPALGMVIRREDVIEAYEYDNFRFLVIEPDGVLLSKNIMFSNLCLSVQTLSCHGYEPVSRVGREFAMLRQNSHSESINDWIDSITPSFIRVINVNDINLDNVYTIVSKDSLSYIAHIGAAFLGLGLDSLIPFEPVDLKTIFTDKNHNIEGVNLLPVYSKDLQFISENFKSIIG